jgi:hypothetical protein
MLVIFQLFIGRKAVETEYILINFFIYKLIIYRYLQNNKISVIRDNAFNNLPSLHVLYVLLSKIWV